MKLKEGEKHRQGAWEIEQRHGYYIVREVLAGGKRRVEERADGYYDVPETTTPEPEPKPVAPVREMSNWHDDRKRLKHIAVAQRALMKDQAHRRKRERQHREAVENRKRRFREARRNGDTEYVDKYQRWYDARILIDAYCAGIGARKGPRPDTEDGWSYSEGRYV